MRFPDRCRKAFTSGRQKRDVIRTIKPIAPLSTKLHIIALGTDVAANLISSDI